LNASAGKSPTKSLWPKRSRARTKGTSNQARQRTTRTSRIGGRKPEGGKPRFCFADKEPGTNRPGTCRFQVVRWIGGSCDRKGAETRKTESICNRVMTKSSTWTALRKPAFRRPLILIAPASNFVAVMSVDWLDGTNRAAVSRKRTVGTIWQLGLWLQRATGRAPLQLPPLS
jgi:hypothetical protein